MLKMKQHIFRTFFISSFVLFFNICFSEMGNSVPNQSLDSKLLNKKEDGSGNASKQSTLNVHQSEIVKKAAQEREKKEAEAKERDKQNKDKEKLEAKKKEEENNKKVDLLALLNKRDKMYFENIQEDLLVYIASRSLKDIAEKGITPEKDSTIMGSIDQMGRIFKGDDKLVTSFLIVETILDKALKAQNKDAVYIFSKMKQDILYNEVIKRKNQEREKKAKENKVSVEVRQKERQKQDFETCYEIMKEKIKNYIEMPSDKKEEVYNEIRKAGEVLGNYPASVTFQGVISIAENNKDQPTYSLAKYFYEKDQKNSWRKNKDSF